MRKVSNAEYQVRQFLVRQAAPAGFGLLDRLTAVAETRMRRSFAVQRHVRGRGIEVGAAASPTIVPFGCKVTYVDKYAEVHNDPDLAHLKFPPPDVIDDAETLETFAANSQDFVLGFSIMEHVQNPIGTIAAFHRVVRSGGTIVVSAPDKRRYHLDTPRPLTTFEHLLTDYREGPAISRSAHFREVGRAWYKLEGPALEEYVEDRVQQDAHCHFHVWDSESFLRFVLDAKTTLGLDYDLVEFATYGVETLAVLRVVKASNGAS